MTARNKILLSLIIFLALIIAVLIPVNVRRDICDWTEFRVCIAKDVNALREKVAVKRWSKSQEKIQKSIEKMVE